MEICVQEVEPKVYIPFQHTSGQVPRRIEIERKKRYYKSIDISKVLSSYSRIDQNGKTTTTDFIAVLREISSITADPLPLSLFDNSDFEVHPVETWVNLVNNSNGNGLFARAMLTDEGNPSNELKLAWFDCIVVKADIATKKFEVIFNSLQVSRTVMLDRIFICFRGEDPNQYCQRIVAAIKFRETTRSYLLYNRYIDYMPRDNIIGLNGNQCERIKKKTSLNVFSSNQQQVQLALLLQILEEYNLNHLRALNKLSFYEIVNNPKNKQLQKLLQVQNLLKFVSVTGGDDVFVTRKEFPIDFEVSFDDVRQHIHLQTLYNKIELIRAFHQIQQETIKLRIKSSIIFKIEKSLRVEEFVSSQLVAANSLKSLVKDHWALDVESSIRNHLKDVKKGWFNINESSNEVYSYSRLKKFFKRINLFMEDTLRDVMEQCCREYFEAIVKHAPIEVSILSMNDLQIHYAKTNGLKNIYPLFFVDIRYNPSLGFSYSSSIETLRDAIMNPFDESFGLLKSITTVERKIMKNLFWGDKTQEPKLYVPQVMESEFQNLRIELLTRVQRSLNVMDEYLIQLEPYKQILENDINEYTSTIESQYCDPSSNEGCNLNHVYELILKYNANMIDISNRFPVSINLGFVLVDCKIIKSLLITKLRSISSRLTELLAKYVLVVADDVSEAYKLVFDKVTVVPSNVEALNEMKEYLSTVPALMESLTQRHSLCDMNFEILDKLNYNLTSDSFVIKWKVFGWPYKLNAEIYRQEKSYRVLESNFKRQQEDDQVEFNRELMNISSDIQRLKDYNNVSQFRMYFENIHHIRDSLDQASLKARLFNARELLFGLTPTEYHQINEYERVFEPYFDLWDSIFKFNTLSETWLNGSLMDIISDEVETYISSFLKNLNKCGKVFERLGMDNISRIANDMKSKVELFKPKVPLITSLRNPGMKDRHWDELSSKTQISFPEDKTLLTLQQVIDLRLENFMIDVEKITEKASKEYSIETALNKMQSEWTDFYLVIEPYRETNTSILKAIDEYNNLLDEHITMTQAMAFSTFKGPFEERIDSWNTSLQTVSEVIDDWVQLQRNWLYLQPIFDSPDINKQLPAEGKRFAVVDKNWRSIMTNASKASLVIKFCDDIRLSERFKEYNKSLDIVQKGLSDYLETKRAGFSRFYFLSNDELLEILSETKDPLRVQPHLRKCFEGIKSVDFQSDLTIKGMISPENEYVPFTTIINPKNKNIENWMVEVKDAMVLSVRETMIKSILDYPNISRTEWMQKWAGQCVLNGSQCHWTYEVEQSLKSKGHQGCEEYYQQLIRQLEDMVLLIRGNISKAARITVGALAVIDVHAKDVLHKMVDAGVAHVTDFDWISQMRYYWEGDSSVGEGDLKVIMVSSKRDYGYEYLGNTFRLVITPLTDKCYLTLMGALQMILGGAPAGPAGTGKTETTKDLAKALAKACVVFNCSDGLDFLAMGKFFKGLASSGSWACFDEFNRINIEVLSVIAQQVIQLQGSVQRGEKRTVFEGTDILVNPEFAVFITMNPGYAGRAELPDNLEALFRPVAMMVPDYGLIGEIMLFSYGYMENRKCALKMVSAFRLCSEQLSSQDHYDYGMRAVKTVITAAGNLKRNFPHANEEALLMRSLQDVNVPKFLAHDLPLFAGIMSDLFPGIDRPAFDYGPLINALKETIYKKNLQPTSLFIRKNIELYEMICVRHGLMVVGPTMGGKSTNIHVLAGALSHLKKNGVVGERFEQVKIYHINPKSITMGQLYGEFDANTHEWRDGILCVIIRQCIRDDDSSLKWILFDGPVDALWIENMNTVLDDNKKLCLTSGEIIQLSDPMTMMFEPEDLAVASPATVSRCGMIFMEPNSLGYDVILQSWIQCIPDKLRTSEMISKLWSLFDLFIPSIIQFLRRYMVEPLPTVNNCLVKGLLNLLDTFFVDFSDTDSHEKKTSEDVNELIDNLDNIFMFCTVWSLCCTGSMESRKQFDAFLHEEIFANNLKVTLSNDSFIYDYLFDVKSKQWIAWKDTSDPYSYDPLKTSFAELIIPTKDSIGYSHLLDVCIRNRKHILMTGPTGVGKTVNILGHIQNKLPCDKYVPITLCFSAQTNQNQTQDLIDSKCEKRKKGVYGPAVGKEFVIFVDDVNMPMKEEYGAQPAIEILRQWFDTEGWYDRKALEFRRIVDVSYVLACGHPGGGRNHVTARFYRHFNIINYVDISNESLKHIFSTILGNFLSTGFDESICRLVDTIVNSTIGVYNVVVNELRPTPKKPHYTFNLRDISKVFQGLLMCDKRKVVSDMQFYRLWIHENSCVFADRLVDDNDKSWFSGVLENRLKEEGQIDPSILWSESKNKQVIYCDFMIPGADVKIYEEVKIEDLQVSVEDYLNEFNAESKQPMNLVLFRDALLHVAKISRILRQPSGHALLLGVGGSGRQSLTKLATYVSSYKLFQIEISKGYGMVEWRENMKQCLFVAGLQNKPIVFLFSDTQIINETMLEDINGLLNSGDIPNLYTTEDLESIATACKQECVKKRLPPTRLNIFGQYLMRVKSNIHVVLCMSPLGDSFRNRLRKFPSIVNCSTIDYFMLWPDQALQSVANRFLNQSSLGFTIELENKLVSFFQYIHQSIEKFSIKYLESLKRHVYVTPTSYLELLSTYYKVLREKRQVVGTLKDHLAIGVNKLISTEQAVVELQGSLTELEPKLVKTQAEVEEMIVNITKDKAAAAETKKIVEMEKATADKKAAETKKIADDAQRDLDEALPALAEAVQCLKDLKKADIDEVKSFGNPSANVRMTMQAVCIMFNVPAEVVNDPDNPGKKKKDYFSAAKRSLLSNPNKLLEDMTNYDKDNIPNSIIVQIEQFANDPNFTPEIIEKASKACKAMCMWTLAMYKYYQVNLIVEPKKLQLAEAQESLAETMKVLEAAEQQLDAAENKIAQLEESLRDATEKKEQLVNDVNQCRSRLDRAVKLMSGLGGERTRWTQSCSDLVKQYDNLVGDSLIAAGSIAYLGAFTPDYRSMILKSWQEKLLEDNIPHSSNCSLRSMLSDPTQVREWQLCGLPSDSHSIENGIIMSQGRRYPLFIDPQGQANRFIKTMGKDPIACPNGLDVIKLSDKNFLRSLENGVRFGKWVLLENVGETLDASLEPLLLQQRFKQSGQEMIKIGDSVIPWNDSFKFFITTKLPNPHYPPEICVKVSLINFAITFIGLEDQLLGVVVIEEMPEMEEKKNALVVSNTKMRKELQDLEDQILFMLSNSQGNILDDELLIETLGTSKVKSQEISLKVQEAEQTELSIDTNRNLYRPVAYRGSILYFCIADLGNIDPMYQYSLQWFRNLFIQAIRLSETSTEIRRRIQSLNDFFTYYVYMNICRSLFERHKLLFSFLLSIRILQGDDLIDNDEWMFLISGKSPLKNEMIELAKAIINPSPDWIDGRMWKDITSLSRLDKFKNLNQDISDNLDDWRDLYDSLNPHEEDLHGQYKDLNAFQKLCILRCIRFDKVPDGVMSYVTCSFGKKFIEPPPFDLQSCFKDSSNTSPLIFVLSKGSDPTKAFIEFSMKMKMERKYRMLSLGQGQGPKAIAMIEEAIQKGYWVLLQNCHLYISWLQELERIIESFVGESIHKDFRLWLTSMPCDSFPVSVLQSSIKMTNEPPKGLKANLRNIYFKLNNDSMNVTTKPYDYMKLLFGLSFFHAVVQERRLFGPLGWNIPYEFNDTDMDISRGQLQMFLDQYEDIPWKVLNFLTSYINYGGRVTDYIDLRTIDVIMKSFYNPNILSTDYFIDDKGIYHPIDVDMSNPHQSYINYIEALPLVASPAVFGMHENAKIASANAESLILFDTCLSLQASTSSSTSTSTNTNTSSDRDTELETITREIYSRIQVFGMFDLEQIAMLYPVTYEESMNTVLLQECVRYNKLIDIMLSTLPTLLLALKGLVVLSSELESLSNSIAINMIPKSWSSVAYPSLKPLGAWVEDLIDRLKFIHTWIDKGVPSVFWISGFYFPQAFLTGSMQNYARKYHIPIDIVSFNFHMISQDWTSLKFKPIDGVYIRGLFLEGARWNNEISSIDDSLPKQLYVELPVIHLLPQENRQEPKSNVYRCPVYKILSRRGVLSTTGHSTNFIMWIEIPSNRQNIMNNEGKADQEVWIRAGVAAFSSLIY